MLKKISAALLLVIALLVPSSTITTTAEAAAPYPGNTFTHHSPDQGYNAPFRLYCHNGAVINLYEGEWSKTKCGSVSHVSLYAGQKMLCYEQNGNVRWFYPGVTLVHEGAFSKDYRCTMQLQ